MRVYQLMSEFLETGCLTADTESMSMQEYGEKMEKEFRSHSENIEKEFRSHSENIEKVTQALIRSDRSNFLQVIGCLRISMSSSRH